ncbi:Hypothetical protein CINCED_3A013767 [Cinara cedri]|uniref:Uncharacterized protein n=1 Tax=Cinara cedri TaxID=506608 RepID=A0A5E4MEM7_9HEMI|nr:Hypothetical protein CINCED_3A013767 [Cinara cedri]
MQPLLLFITPSSKIDGKIVFIPHLLIINFYQYLKKAVTAVSITTSEENVEIEDHFEFFDFGPVTQNDRTDTSMSAKIEVLKYFEDPF